MGQTVRILRSLPAARAPCVGPPIASIRILISYVTAGTGHRRAAEALAETIQRRLPGADVRCVDLLAYTPRWLRWAYPCLYGWLVQHLPWVWGLGYHLLDRKAVFRVCQPWRRRWNRVMAKRFVRWVIAERPDVILATHFFSADVLAAARRAGSLPCRLIVVITDLFPHRLWLVPDADAVVAGSPETYALCRSRGMASDRLHQLGIPIAERFHPLEDRAALRRSLGLAPARRTLLMASGGKGFGPVEQLVHQVRRLETIRPNALQLLVVCGDNPRLVHRLQRACRGSRMPVQVFGFVETMHELMQASDVLVTKAGGLTVMEALAVGLPMVLCGTIPGQERFNADYVVRHGAGVAAHRPNDAVQRVVHLLDHPEQLEAMRAHASSLGRPQAAADIVERLILAHGLR